MIITTTKQVPRRRMDDMIWFPKGMMVPFTLARCTLRCGSLIRARADLWHGVGTGIRCAGR